MDKTGAVEPGKTRCDRCGRLSTVVDESGEAYCADCASRGKQAEFRPIGRNLKTVAPQLMPRHKGTDSR